MPTLSDPPLREGRPTAAAGVARQQARWLVHVALMATFAGALLVLVTNHGNSTVHVVLGLSFSGLVVVHLLQRRRTVRRLVTHLSHAGTWLRPQGRLAFSDLVLAFVVVNVLVSGIADLVEGYNVGIPLHDIGLPIPFMSWHTLSSVVLLVYLLVHLLRRKDRLVHSRVR